VETAFVAGLVFAALLVAAVSAFVVYLLLRGRA
jgi:hypothetical protein